MHTVYRLVTLTDMQVLLSPLEVFSLFVAALGHDIGHPGVNNVFLVKSRDKLAIIHNDRSPLENMHCALLYEIMVENDANIFATLSDEQWREARKIVITTILGTDMAHHFEQISKVQVFLEVNGENFREFYRGETESIDAMHDQNVRLLLIELLLHVSDISNPFKPFKICERWANLVVEEFFAQGDREASEGMEVSPMMNRTETNIFNMQMGFIEFVVSPLVNGVINLYPPLYEAGRHMTDNMLAWGNLRIDELQNDQTLRADEKDSECAKLRERLNKFRQNMAFVDALEEFTLNEKAH
jgi:hypothetical protein